MEFSRQFDSLAVSWAELFRGESGQAARNDNLQLSPEISVTSIPPTPGLFSPAPALATPAPVYTPDNMITAALESFITLALHIGADNYRELSFGSYVIFNVIN